MFELLFPVTLFFLAYVAYDAYQAIMRAERGEPVFKNPPAVTAPMAKAAPAPAASKAAAPAKPAAAAAAAAEPAPAKRNTAKPTPPPAKAAAATPAVAPEVRLADTLRNPATGEVSPAPANYRFAKKWIKDALVSEKLLDRVYKPSELDDAASLKVKDAIDKLRAIKKYQA
jgi:hypothetical protein